MSLYSENVTTVTVRPTLAHIGLAAALAVIVYAVLWNLGATLGFIQSDFAVVAVGVLLLARRRAKRPLPRQLAGDVVASIATGLILKMMTQLSIGMLSMTLVTPTIAGVAVGIARREHFVPFFSSTLRKVAFSFLLACGLAVLASFSFYLTAALDVPDHAITPARIAEGWSPAKDSFDISELVHAGRDYQKDASFLRVWAERFPEPPRKQKEYMEEAEFYLSSVELDPQARLTVELVREEILREREQARYKFLYRIESRQKPPHPLRAWVFYFWRCPDPATDIKAWGMIKGEPVEHLLREVEEMVDSLTCP